jgi:hypothetical protein
MQDIPADTKKRGPSSRVLQEVIRQAPADYVTVGWLTSTLHRHSFGIITAAIRLGVLAGLCFDRCDGHHEKVDVA